MLLFISTARTIWQGLFVFQYIPCYCLSFPKLYRFPCPPDFNTSHVTVYHFPFRGCSRQGEISIHPMLLFIFCAAAALFISSTFQYIPCYCLSDLAWRNSMEEGAFQYIPCYCLSCRNLWGLEQCSAFQYIPCYCLSFTAQSLNFLSSEFQYIPCYCLSASGTCDIVKFVSFQYIPCYCLS